MRSTVRLLAAVKPGRYLEAGNPTGLTGLFTHPSPRSRLLYLYGSILQKLKSFPESSVYRQSTEALTTQRMNIIAQIKPAGYEEWQQRAAEKLKQHPHMFEPGNLRYEGQKIEDSFFVQINNQPVLDEAEWDGEKGRVTREGTKGQRGGTANAAQASRRAPDLEDPVQWELEPPLEATQISDAENQIGAGLIEEVIQVAEGELQLVDIMTENKVWEELEEKPPAGQWDYFARDQHTPGTQEPPSK